MTDDRARLAVTYDCASIVRAPVGSMDFGDVA
jgi:hypothetical protein